MNRDLVREYVEDRNELHAKIDRLTVERDAAILERDTALTDSYDRAAELRAENDGLKAFLKEVSNALLKVRPLGGSELFVKRFDDYYADPAYCGAAIEEKDRRYHEAMKARVRAERERDAIRATVIEECAKVADDHRSDREPSGDDIDDLIADMASCTTREEIAASIRALATPAVPSENVGGE